MSAALSLHPPVALPAPRPAPVWILKQCGTCATVYTPSEWRTLAYVGVQRFDDADIRDLELRNCSCGSTIAVEVSDVA